MAFADRKFVILTSSEVGEMDADDFALVCQTNAASMRWNADESKSFVKYEGSKPRFLYGKDVLTYAEMKTELEEDEWNPEVEELP